MDKLYRVFGEPALVAKYGSWVRVQVAFYDFIFTTALGMCENHIQEHMLSGFRDGDDPYEVSVGKIEEVFESFEVAWSVFLVREGI